MCAQFHPKEDLVVSASLDQTVRVWDLSGLRNKTVSAAPHSPAMGGGDDSLRLGQNDLFGNPSVVVKYVLEGHDRGVNWAAFHPSLPLIVSGADDRYVKLWRYNDTKAWEVDTLRAHYNNVSCVLFHPHQELILSNSEDKTIRVWDMSKRTAIQSFRREHDRFWIMAAHPEKNLFAAGHDSGLLVFKLERERPAYDVHKGVLYYVKDRYLRTYECSSTRDVPVLAIRRNSTKPPISLSYNPAEKAVLICSDVEGGYYELYKVPADGKSNDSVTPKKGSGLCAVFVKRNRFAVLDTKTQMIWVKNLNGDATKQIPCPVHTDYIFTAGLGCVLLRSDDRMVLFDLQQRRKLGEIPTSTSIKYVVWSEDTRNPSVALLSKDTVILADRKLGQLCTISETIRVKSGAWDENGVFIYTTLNHIKYCLRNGDHGIIRTLEAPVYITAVRRNKVYCLDREGRNRVIIVDNTEYMFKLALMQRKYGEVLNMVRPGQNNLVGQSIIAYLQQKGFPEVALHFVKDEKTKFNLALECGKIDVATTCARALDDKESWHRLGAEALRQGNHQVVEIAYQRTKNFDRLSFLYLITGNTERLGKMLKIAEMRQDTMSRFHNALYLGDVAERVRILEEANQLSFAYITAATHNLTDQMESLAQKLGGNLPEVPDSSETRLLQPPIPIMRNETNWPLLTVSPGYFDNLEDHAAKFGGEAISAAEDVDAAGWDEDAGSSSALAAGADDGDTAGWGDDEDVLGEGEGSKAAAAGEEEEGGGWGDDEELAGLDEVEASSASSKDAFFVVPRHGPSARETWIKSSKLAADHAAAGSFETAMELLNQQAGIVNFEPLRPFFMTLATAAFSSFSAVSSTPSLLSPIHRNWNTGANLQKDGQPVLCLKLQQLIDRLKVAYTATTKGQFGEALAHFQYIMHALLFVVVDSRQAQNEVKELLELCKEYATGLRIELSKKDLPQGASSAVRQLELAAYFTTCKLQPIHRMLTLRAAMKAAHRVKNYATAASFARRLLELNPKPEIANEARKVVKFAESNPNDEHQIDYDERNPFVVCSRTFTPIYKNKPTVFCPYCNAAYVPSEAGKLCLTCNVAEIGKQATGHKVLAVGGNRD
ncbi:Coatomer subunit alpha, variant 3 [Balamuthia mandrillaris]